MFGWLKRLFGIVQSEANSALDKLEDPVKMTEQGIKDMKKDLTVSLQALAEIKAQTIRSKKSLEGNKKAAQNYENKAILLLNKAQSGELDAGEADRLASQALNKKEQLSATIATEQKNVNELDKHVSKMEENVQKLRSQISLWENEAKTLKARAQTSKLSAKVNKQLSRVDASDTISRLEKMKSKVEQQEALAESYADIADANTTVDDEIDRALGGSVTSSAALDKLKEQMKLNAAGGSTESSSESTTDSGNTSSGGGNQPLSDLDKLKQKLKATDNPDS